MEPTIYKPNIYKGAGIYNTGAGGGGGVNGDYETDFSNFDFVNKVDIPNKGFITFYNDKYSFSIDTDGLKITAPSGNQVFSKTLGFYAQDGSELEFNFIFEQNSKNPSFIWFLDSCTFVCNTDEQNTVIVLVKDQYDFTSTDKLSYYGHNYGYYYYKTNYPYGDLNTAKLKFFDDRVEVFFNDEKIFVLNQSKTFTQLDYNPRNSKYIITNKIKFTK